MIKSKLIFCAETIAVDRQSNHISAFNMFDDLKAASFPLFFPRFSILSIVERDASDPEDVELDLKVTLADKPIIEQKPIAHFQGSLSTRVIMIFGGMTIANPGHLAVQISKEETLLGKYEINIAPLSPPQPIESA